MKKKNVMLSVATIVLLGMTACKENPHPTPGALYPGTPACVIKFDKPEYKEHIMVYSSEFGEGTTHLCNERLVLPDSVIHLCGKSPYIELPDDYLLVDWKWGRIYYINDEAIINEKWTELKDADTYWPISEIIVKYPVAEVYGIPRRIMKDYNNGSLKYDGIDSMRFDLGWSVDDWSWNNRFSDEMKTSTLKHIAFCDSVQAEFAEILTRMINEGNLPDECRLKLRYK